MQRCMMHWGIAQRCVCAYIQRMQIIDIIKRLRGAGFTQAEIARRTGIPQYRVSRWENGAVPVGAEDALKLAELVARVERPEQPAA